MLPRWRLSRVGHQAHRVLLGEALLDEIVELAPGHLLLQRLAGQALQEGAEILDVFLEVFDYPTGKTVPVEQLVDVLAREEGRRAPCSPTACCDAGS